MEELENVGSLKIFIPLGPWRKGEKYHHFYDDTRHAYIEYAGDPWEEAISDMLRTNALMHMVGMRPLLREYVVLFHILWS
jgi:hypothetical protein